MHYADLEKSDRLKRVAKFLSDGRRHGTLEIIRRAKVCAVNSIASELRENGLKIDCWREGNIWYYRQVRRCGRGE